MQDDENSHNQASSVDYHLDYLDEFLKLRCAPDLLEMGLFPNSKEITETFAVWAALRRHIFPHLSKSRSSNDNRQDAIIVVGDGMTPRTAALCAFLTKGLWQCYSIDPMLQYDTYTDMMFLNRRSTTTEDRCNQWKTIKGLRMARTKIQAVSIPCRQAIVVMMHAHVTLDDAISAVDASEGIVGIITCPCCKWGPSQQEWLGQAPHQQYTDLKLFSVKNQMNVWCFPQGCPIKSSTTSTITNERNIWGMDISVMETVLSSRDGVKQRAIDLWPHIFSNGIQAFNINNDINQLSDDSELWPWGSTAWSPKDILPLMKSCSLNSTPSSDNVSDSLPIWFRKPVLIVGKIVAMRRCKHTIFYELNSCSLPSEQLENILRLTCDTLPTQNPIENKQQHSSDTFPGLLKSADRIWTCVEYQRHVQALISYDPTVERKSKRQNSSDDMKSTDTDRVNVVLNISSYDRKNSSESTDNSRVKLFGQNPQPHQSLFPWAIYLRPGDILVTYCELGCNSSKGPQLCMIDGILLFDSILHMTGIDRRILP